jgi:hypothetical protein
MARTPTVDPSGFLSPPQRLAPDACVEGISPILPRGLIMKTPKDAERAVELCRMREELHRKASAIRTADAIAVCDPTEKWEGARQVRGPSFRFTHLVDDLRDLVRREAERQITEIDSELGKLGIVPDELAEPEPPEAEPRTGRKAYKVVDGAVRVEVS